MKIEETNRNYLHLTNNIQPTTKEELERNSWIEGVSDSSAELARKILERNELFALGLLGVAGGAQLLSLQDTVYKPLFEMAAEQSAKAAIGVFAAGELYDRLFLNKRRELGLVDIPENWSGHTVLFDLNRELFDAVSRVNPRHKNVVVHDGSLVNNEGLVGTPLNYKQQRHINAGDYKFLSDERVLQKIHPEYAGGIFINLWNPEDALYREAYGTSNLVIKPERALNILLTLSHGWKNQRAIIIAPQELRQGIESVGEVFSHDNFHQLRSLRVVHPEDIVENELAMRLNMFEQHEQQVPLLAIDSDIPAIQERFATNMGKRGIKLIPIEEAGVVVVDRESDDEVIYRSWQLTKMGKKALAYLERSENSQEAELVGAIAWPLPDIVARGLPIRQMTRRYGA